MNTKNCEICGEPMPPGEEMFKFHGYSGPCPRPAIPRKDNPTPQTAAACECLTWARADDKPFRTKHHPNCKHFDPCSDAAEVINGLLKGIDAWAGDEDGVHYGCWEAYKTACVAVGRGLPPEEHDVR